MACSCLAHKIDYTPSADASATRKHLVLLYAATDSVDAEERAETMFRDVCLHESGHAVVAAVCGRTTVSASVGGAAPRVEYGPDVSRSLLHGILYTAAGDAAQYCLRGEIFSPTWSTLQKYLGWARANETGFCDSCWIASALVERFSDKPDNELVTTWRGFLWIANSLFADDEVASATRTLARELHMKTLLNCDEIEAVIKNYAIAGALDRVCVGVDIEEMLPCWR